MKKQDLFNLFKTAIEREQSAQQLYEEMIAGTDDTEAKKLLESFLGQEKYHEEKLKEVYAELKDKLKE
ncbi:MAG: ferritin family protein [bacterium]|jgi:rubrerythrin|nr:ferritin family protein [bacterium]